MSSSSAVQSNSYNGSPLPASEGPTTTRRCVANLVIDMERSFNFSDFFDHEGGDVDDSSISGTHFQNLHHHQYYFQHLVIWYLLLCSQAFFCMLNVYMAT